MNPTAVQLGSFEVSNKAFPFALNVSTTLFLTLPVLLHEAPIVDILAKLGDTWVTSHGRCLLEFVVQVDGQDPVAESGVLERLCAAILCSSVYMLAPQAIAILLNLSRYGHNWVWSHIATFTVMHMKCKETRA